MHSKVCVWCIVCVSALYKCRSSRHTVHSSNLRSAHLLLAETLSQQIAHQFQHDQYKDVECILMTVSSMCRQACVSVSQADTRCIVDGVHTYTCYRQRHTDNKSYNSFNTINTLTSEALKGLCLVYRSCVKLVSGVSQADAQCIVGIQGLHTNTCYWQRHTAIK